VELSLQHRQVGYVTVVTCRGRLVSGPEADALLQRIDDLLEAGADPSVERAPQAKQP
jgi:hypothetical protein